MTKENLRFLLIYASQTGQAQAIAEEIAENAPAQGFQADVHCMSLVEKKFSLEREKLAVIITSTTGDGEPPDTGSKFWRRIRKKTLPITHFSNLKYALLGLGDTNYTNFCKCGKALDDRLEELGAKRFFPSGWADDATGLEVVVEPWIDSLWSALRQNISTEAGHTSDSCQTYDTILANRTDDTQVGSTSNGSRSLDDLRIMNGVSEVSNNSVNNSSELIPLSTSNGTTVDPLTNDSGQNSAVDQISKSLTDINMGTHRKEDESLTRTVDPVLPESLTHSVPPLSSQALTLPLCPPQYLDIEFGQDSMDLSVLPIQNGAAMPSASSDTVHVPIIRARKLTSPDAVKTALLLTLDTEMCNWTYLPGDSFSIVCPNSDCEVQLLLERLHCTKLADLPYSLSVKSVTKKKNAAIPSFIPAKATLRHIFTTCCDFRKVPKKALVRALVEHTTDPHEKRRLQEICSKQGAEIFARYLRQPSLGLLDLLLAFPSCQPPVQVLLEHIERLQPRPYSIASSPLAHPHHVDIVFNVVEVPAGQGRQGICTGWLNRITLKLQHAAKYCVKSSQDPNGDTTTQLEQVSLENLSMVPVFWRSNQHFRPPEDLTLPLIMVGPGTGVAPFIGFLQHRENQMSKNQNIAFGESWLFFGCRHKERDFLFRHELEAFKESGVLSRLEVSFSRDSPTEDGPKYVQDNLRLHGEVLAELLMERNAQVYVCGDATNMSKDVNTAFVELLQTFKGLSERDALGFIAKLRLGRRYLEDVWT